MSSRRRGVTDYAKWAKFDPTQYGVRDDGNDADTETAMDKERRFYEEMKHNKEAEQKRKELLEEIAKAEAEVAELKAQQKFVNRIVLGMVIVLIVTVLFFLWLYGLFDSPDVPSVSEIMEATGKGPRRSKFSPPPRH